MTKVLFILSAVVMLVSSFFAYQNGREFAGVRTKVATLGNEIKTEEASDKKLIASVGVIRGDITRVQGEVDTEAEKLKAQKNRLAQADGDLVRTQEELQVKSAKQKELADKLDKLPKDVKVETLSENINLLKKEKLEFESLTESKKKEVAAEEEKVAGIQKRVDDVLHKIEERRHNFDRNSLSARILAVNHDWGFVVIETGKNAGLTEETKLIVTRGIQTVGKVSVLTVDGTRAVASIMPNVVASGEEILPGDRVILENLVQN